MTKIKFEEMNGTRGFKNDLVKHFERSKKSSWGRNQVVNAVKDLWIKHLESFIEQPKEG